MLKEIRNQPEHIRAIFMWLSVFIVFSLVVFVWAGPFQQKLTLLLNPSQDSAVAKQGSPFAVISQSFNDLKATILDLFGLVSGMKNGKNIKNNLEDRFGEKVEPRLLPISE